MKANRSTFRLLLSMVAFSSAGLSHAYASAQEAPPAQTREACESAYSACFSEYGFYGLFLCSGQYGQCLAQVEGTAGNTNESLSKVKACRDTAATCRTDAGEDREKLAVCSQTERACVSDALGVDTTASDKARGCFETSQQCMQTAEGNEALSKCLTDLRTCLAPPTEPEPTKPD